MELINLEDLRIKKLYEISSNLLEKNNENTPINDVLLAEEINTHSEILLKTQSNETGSRIIGLAFGIILEGFIHHNKDIKPVINAVNTILKTKNKKIVINKLKAKK